MAIIWPWRWPYVGSSAGGPEGYGLHVSLRSLWDEEGCGTVPSEQEESSAGDF